jgi:competence protein ComEA
MELLTASRRRAIALAAVVLLATVLIVRHLAHGSPAAELGPPVAPAAAGKAAGAKLFIHVVGAVRRPGLYRLADGSRIADALRRAGGATRKADLAAVNLAAPLADGLQVVVPSRAPTGSGSFAGSPADPTATQGPVHLNTASLEQLDSLPGVGPVTTE